MSRYIQTRKWKIGLFCGSRIWRLSDWRLYGIKLLPKRTVHSTGFNIGPILFWKDL